MLSIFSNHNGEIKNQLQKESWKKHRNMETNQYASKQLKGQKKKKNQRQLKKYLETK